MVLFFTSNDEDLIRHEVRAYTQLSSAHVYLRMPEGMEWTAIPEALVEDCAQLVKAHSIEGNKKNNITVIYTPHANIKRFYIKERKNEIMNRLNKTKEERDVDFETERQKRERAEGRKKKEHALQQKKETLEAKRHYKEQAAAKDYSHLFSDEAIAEAQREKQRQARLQATKRAQDDDEQAWDSDDSFM
ncbi:hypothetical protein MNAN1_002693 [Malassezia nana]|uniref:NFACT RNA-binding domain-containing protein n=1 Tax=Malassezia nana TaxID=180528 RepID=A0AAF0EN61_9BASI|nr:hypothetical protein MNAN1_002693 [Malassezia nana]